MVTTTRKVLAPNVRETILEELSALVGVPEDHPSMGVAFPFTEAEIGQVLEATRADVAAAVDRARRAQQRWSRTPIRERISILSRFHDLLIERADIAMDIIQLEAGKARVPAFEEVYDTIATTRYYMKTGPGLLRRKRRAVSLPGMTTAYEYRHPRGVVGSITPWNSPFTLAISDIIPALLAGNAVGETRREHTLLDPGLQLLVGLVVHDHQGAPRQRPLTCRGGGVGRSHSVGGRQATTRYRADVG